METLSPQSTSINEHNLQQMLLLADRLREARGGELDDAAIVAVAEACALPEEYVRATVGRLPDSKTRRGLFSQLRNAILSLEPDTRRHVGTGLLATNFGLLNVVMSQYSDRYGLVSVTAMILMALAIWNFAVCRNGRVALVTGALFGGLFFIARSLFMLAMHTQDRVEAFWIVPLILAFGGGAFAIQMVISKLKQRLGAKDPVVERQELLQQLVELQDRLKSGQQSMAFLSLDVVGSTKMKQNADVLNAEYTFTEYHKWVEMATHRFGGKVHSTAGDGVTCAFDHPQQAYAAARYMQSGIVEFNTFRNKIGEPLLLRAGIHAGVVNAPAGEDITKINFASVIDIAAHMQKVAPTGGIAISDAAAQAVAGGPKSIGSEQVEISNTVGWVWQPRALAAPGGAVPPPPPV